MFRTTLFPRALVLMPWTGPSALLECLARATPPALPAPPSAAAPPPPTDWAASALRGASTALADGAAAMARQATSVGRWGRRRHEAQGVQRCLSTLVGTSYALESLQHALPLATDDDGPALHLAAALGAGDGRAAFVEGGWAVAAARGWTDAAHRSRASVAVDHSAAPRIVAAFDAVGAARSANADAIAVAAKVREGFKGLTVKGSDAPIQGVSESLRAQETTMRLIRKRLEFMLNATAIESAARRRVVAYLGVEGLLQLVTILRASSALAAGTPSAEWELRLAQQFAARSHERCYSLLAEADGVLFTQHIAVQPGPNIDAYEDSVKGPLEL